MDNLEYYIRRKLGQTVFNKWIETWRCVETEHARFDMSFGSYTSEETDPVLGPFSDLLNYDGGIEFRRRYIIRFWKGCGSIYCSDYNGFNLISDNEGGKGTVQIIKDLILNHTSKEARNIIKSEFKMIITEKERLDKIEDILKSNKNSIKT